MSSWNFFFAGVPVMRRPRSRTGQAQHFTHPQTKKEQKLLKDRFWALFGSPRTTLWVSLSVHVYPENEKYPDLNNVIGCVQDALNKVCWEDDQQVKRLDDCEMHCHDPSVPSGIMVRITEL